MLLAQLQLLNSRWLQTCNLNLNQRVWEVCELTEEDANLDPCRPTALPDSPPDQCLVACTMCKARPLCWPTLFAEEDVVRLRLCNSPQSLLLHFILALVLALVSCLMPWQVSILPPALCIQERNSLGEAPPTDLCSSRWQAQDLLSL